MERPATAPSNVTLVVLGKALGAHGTRGEAARSLDGRRAGQPDASAAGRARATAARIQPHAGTKSNAVAPGRGGEVRVEFRGIETREAAAALSGLLVLGDASHLEPLPAGEHYWYEWIGCAVEASDGRKLGTVRELWETGAHDVLVVEDETGRQLLLPAAGALLREVDVAGRRIVIEVPAGLLDPL